MLLTEWWSLEVGSKLRLRPLKLRPVCLRFEQSSTLYTTESYMKQQEREMYAKERSSIQLEKTAKSETMREGEATKKPVNTT